VKETAMNKPVLLAAMATVTAGLPLGAFAQEGGPGTTPPQPGCAARAEAPRADSSLPARASDKPEPQLGTVAPTTRVPSHTDTPSSRAMAAASARAEKTTDAGKNAQGHCAGDTVPPAPGNSRAKPEGA
jgi:hypothetical protein